MAAEGEKPTASAINSNNHEFMVPKKEIGPGPDDIPKWEKSEAYRDLIGFLLAMNDAVKGKKISDARVFSPVIESLLKLLDMMEGWIAKFPPVEQPQRFGNTAFRDWFDKLKQEAPGLVRDLLGPKHADAAEEVSTYLVEGVGNQTRIDYGTGHELAFAAFLLCLYKLDLLKETDAEAVVLNVFTKYLQLVRKLQLTYRMEPAGSQGVWALDDHQFIPFIWGSAQLISHPRIQPKSFVKPEIYEHFAKDYVFLSCIKYINEVKTGPFAEHSNQLWNISAVPHWEKVNSGLVKMYKAEVLAKFPVIQHFLFGSLLRINPTS
ncbi:serine/threonine-protein phosphatase 2A activator-like [Mya arenaria]|uniref:serine/threonine-protein phosphatase 2A activator-like n=1 Tax=Mya arenaria TaxID=6604 RepID=UPI0022E98445|nr:serine/threonine-protein phosphatase 2A activator-like [Mya arenaria]